MSNSKNKQFVVIDGLARSGTTLFHSVMNSQNSITSYRGILVEPLAIRNLNNIFKRQSWVVKNLTSDFIDLESIHFNPFNRMYFNGFNFKKKTFQLISSRNQYQTFTLNQWKEILGKQIKSFEDIDGIYGDILERSQKKILSLRWNNCINYYYAWTFRKNHKWISIIRNPEDRAISYQKSHGSSLQNSLMLSINFAKKLSQIKGDKNLKILYYEDFINNPKSVMNEVFNFLNLDDTVEINKILNSDGKEYRNETSDLVNSGISRKDGVKFSGFVEPKSYEKSFSFKKHLNQFDIYKRYF